MALTGIREVSHILTPPEDRHPILTYVGPDDSRVVSAAIRRELLREGQVFYVHNRIRSIDRAVERLRAGRPLRGGPRPDERGPARADHAGLLGPPATTCWSPPPSSSRGLDLPQVNTLIVERADQLGLAQLYQLRGRVGRSSSRGLRPNLFHPRVARLVRDGLPPRLEAVGGVHRSGVRAASGHARPGDPGGGVRAGRDAVVATSRRWGSTCTWSWSPRRWRTDGTEPPPRSRRRCG